jgi:hypothetical protein
MQVGLRLPQTERGHATKENIILLAKQAENANFLEVIFMKINSSQLVILFYYLE